MKIPDHVLKYGMEYLVVAILGLAGLGALAYMDNRHVRQIDLDAANHKAKVDWYDEKIEALDDDTNRLNIYNQAGSKLNVPARKLIIEQNVRKRSRLVSKKEAYIADEHH